MQQFIQLKKEITDQTIVIKQQQERLVAVTMERDQVVAELKSIKAASIPVSMDVKHGGEAINVQDDDCVSVFSTTSSTCTSTRLNKKHVTPKGAFGAIQQRLQAPSNSSMFMIKSKGLDTSSSSSSSSSSVPVTVPVATTSSNEYINQENIPPMPMNHTSNSTAFGPTKSSLAKQISSTSFTNSTSKVSTGVVNNGKRSIRLAAGTTVRPVENVTADSALTASSFVDELSFTAV